MAKVMRTDAQVCFSRLMNVRINSLHSRLVEWRLVATHILTIPELAKRVIVYSNASLLGIAMVSCKMTSLLLMLLGK
jgi:hypothetical protein